MELIVLGSNSSGNAYILRGMNQSILIEAGIHPSEVKKAMDFTLDSIVGCIISHEHGDHFKYVDDLVKCGINVYASPGTLKDKIGHRYFEVDPLSTFILGEFKIKPFEVKHDARQPYGYIINHPEAGNILFLTDTHYSSYKFNSINHVIVEANHSRELIDNKLFDGKIPHFMYKRIANSHMSIETCIQLLEANVLDNVLNIILIHLSDANSNEIQFKKQIEDKIGKKVTIANKGTKINLNLKQF